MPVPEISEERLGAATAQVAHQEPHGEKDAHKQAEYDNVYGENLKGEHRRIIAAHE